MRNWLYVHSKEDWDSLVYNTMYKGKKAPTSYPCLVCPRIGPWNFEYPHPSTYDNYLYPSDVEKIAKGEFPRIDKERRLIDTLAERTVAHYAEIPERSFWVELKGDLSHLDGIFINSYKLDATKEEKEKEAALQNELTKLLYDKDGKFALKKIDRHRAKELIKQGAELIECGFIL